MNSQDTTPPFSLSHLLHLLVRYKGTILLPTLLGVGGAIYLHLREPPVYLSEARLLVRYVTEASLVEEEAGAGRIKSPDARGFNIINSELDILTSRVLVEDVVDELGVEFVMGQGADPAARGAAVMRVFRNLQVDVPRRSNVIRLQFTHSSPDVAQRVLDRIVHHYLEKHAIIHKMTGEYEFLTQQTDMLRSRLTQTEDELRRLKQDIGMTTLAETKSLLMGRLEALNASRREATAALAAAKARYEFAARQLGVGADAEVTGLADLTDQQRRRVEPISQRLGMLRDRETALLASFSDESTLVRDVRRQIALAEEMLQREAGDADISRLLAGPQQTEDETVALMAEVVSLEARIDVLRGYVEEAQESIDELHRREAQLVRLQRQWEMLEVNYRNYARSLEHAQIQDMLTSGQQSNISIVQPAFYPIAASYPNRKRNVLVALGGGLAVGLLLVLLREWLRGLRVADPSDAERTIGAPVLISVPFAAARGLLGRRVELPAALALPAHEDHPDERSTVASSRFNQELRPYFDALCDRMLMQLNGNDQQPILIGLAGCRAGAGVSTVAAGLGAALSRVGVGRILLVDASEDGGDRLRGPTAGVIDLLRDENGRVAVLQPNLYMLTAYESNEASGRVTMFQRIQDLLKSLEAGAYRYVILQLPPISETSAALTIGRHLTGILLVLEAERDRKEQAERAVEMLRASGVTVLGSVLNKRKPVAGKAA